MKDKKLQTKTLSDLLWENVLEWNKWLRMGVTEEKQQKLAPKFQKRFVAVDTLKPLVQDILESVQRYIFANPDGTIGEHPNITFIRTEKIQNLPELLKLVKSLLACLEVES